MCAGVALKGLYDPPAVFFFRINIHNVSPGRLYVAVSEELAHQFDVMGVAVKPGRYRPADIVRGLGRFNPGTPAELPDPVIDCTAGDPLPSLTKKQVILILEGVLLVDLQNLPDQIHALFAERKNAVSIDALLLGVLDDRRLSGFTLLFLPLDMDGFFLLVDKFYVTFIVI